MDYCGNCNTDGTTNASNNSDKRVVRLRFLRNQLLYDIKNYAFVEADVMGEDNTPSMYS